MEETTRNVAPSRLEDIKMKNCKTQLVADEAELIEASEGMHEENNKRDTIERNPTNRKPFSSRGSLCLQGAPGKLQRHTI